MAVLKGISGDTAGILFELTKDETTIGRHGANMLVISDGSVSAFHCAIIKDGGRYTLRDLDSTNGTKVNEEPVKVRRLTAGSVIHVGNVKLLLEGDDIETEELSAAESPRLGPAPKVSSTTVPAHPLFKEAKRNSEKLIWVTITFISILSALLVAVVIYSISHLK